MSNEITPMIEQKRMMVITSLLNETLPNFMFTPELMTEIGIDQGNAFGLVQLLFDNQMKAIIEGKDGNDVADWKASIHAYMLDEFDAPYILNSFILNLAPYTRTLVYSFRPEDLPILKDHIIHWFTQINAYMEKEGNGQMIGFANPQIISIKDIGKLYKQLRQLQDYQYTIGMATMTFYGDCHFHEHYSVAEYKYIQRYEELLKAYHYSDLFSLLDELYNFIMAHFIKDSKVIYIYKELMSFTIRHLYSNETTNLKVIESLNYAINNFSNRFNDLNEVSHYIENLIKSLQAASSEHTNYHPHVNEILQAIDAHYKSDLTLDGFANQFNVSSAHLSRLFKEEVGISFKQYLTKYRLDIIKDLLNTSEKTIQAIAALTGYQSANQLTRIFKKYEQMTPRSYRMGQHK